MNNDFNVRPTNPQSKNTNTSPNSEPSFSQEPDQPDQPQQTPEPAQPVQVITSKKSPGKIRRFFSFLALLILIALVGGGVWYWQQTQIKNLNTAKTGLEAQVSSLQSKVAADKETDSKKDTTATPAASPATRTDIVTGSVTTNTTEATAVSVLYLPGAATEVWVEYGTAPDKLTSSATRVKGTGAGTAGTYVDQGFNLAELQDGTRYFYRAAATVDGKTVYGGVAGFQAGK